ncbi:MAG: hypothetical protein HYU44_07875 [Betaproteobacteria bacterium]|nr:hypothetical protein [Betaproteobacteria bacterium]
MLLANNVAVAARAFITGLNGQDIAAVQALDATGVGHLKPADDDEALCLAHCAQSYQNHEQELATNAFKVAFLPALLVPYSSVAIKPAASLLALAPQAAGPPLTILFHNLRN